jgi:hypothetical protein
METEQPKLVSVFEGATIDEARMAVGYLNSNGIDAFVNSNQAFPLYVSDPGDGRVFVNRSDVNEARTLLESLNDIDNSGETKC